MDEMSDMSGRYHESTLKGCNITNILTISCIIFSFTVFIPLCLYFAFPLFLKRKELILQKRHVNLSLLAILYLILQLISENIASLFDFDVLYEMRHGPIIKWAQFLTISVYCFTVSGFIMITFVRFFLIYYDIKYNVLIANEEWKSIIDNSHYEILKSNFFIKYKSTFGNEKFWIKFIFFDSILNAILSPFLAYFQQQQLLFIHNGLFYVAFIIIYSKFRRLKFWDYFFIIKELRILGQTILCILLLWGLLRFSTEILNHMNKQQMKFKHEYLMTSYLYAVYLLSMIYDIFVVYITSYWIIHKLDNNKIRNKSESSADKKSKSICLKGIFGKSEYLECFIHHLSHEFSLECILAFIEFLQFKQFAITQSESVQGNDTTETMYNKVGSDLVFELPSCVPKSSIVYDTEHDLTWKAEKLFDKYVAMGSEYEINIGHAIRACLTFKFQKQNRFKRTLSRTLHRDRVNTLESCSAYLEKQNDNNLIGVFDGCIKTMVTLLRYSFTRFKTKSQFVKIHNAK